MGGRLPRPGANGAAWENKEEPWRQRGRGAFLAKQAGKELEGKGSVCPGMAGGPA